MRLVSVHDRDAIESFLRPRPYLHLYELGDLDDFFWEHTVWYALKSHAGRIEQLVLLYTDQSIPTLVALSEHPAGSMRDLLQGLDALLPRRLYAHLSTEAAAALAAGYQLRSNGIHHKMGLLDSSRPASFDTSEVVTLTTGDAEELATLYRTSYPGNWFVPRMLETGLYQGIRRGGSLVSVAGVHVYSPRYRVAALGNVATDPDWRGRGLGTRVSARLCQALIESGIAHIGLNVKGDNRAALTCYERLGFRRVADYGEYTLERNGT